MPVKETCDWLYSHLSITKATEGKGLYRFASGEMFGPNLRDGIFVKRQASNLMLKLDDYKKELPVLERRSVYISETEPSKIWGEVFDKDIDEIKRLYSAMKQMVCEKTSLPLFYMFSSLFYWLLYRKFGKFMDESRYMSKMTGVLTTHQVAFLQRQYTLAHAAFCSTTVTWDEELKRMVCFRSMDWDGADHIANSTRIFDLKNTHGETIGVVAGIAGMQGALTGVKKGFSIAGNYAPWSFSARFRTDPTFLIREILQDERINSYAEAREAISRWKVGAPCFITLCGVNKGEAAVCEFGARNQKDWREVGEDELLVQTNHYSYRKFLKHNKKFYSEEPGVGWYQSDLMKNSLKRQQLILAGIKTSLSSGRSLVDNLKNIYRIPPVMNKKTAQWVLMSPGTDLSDENSMAVTALISKDASG